MKIINKILAALLVLVMMATMLPVAFAEGVNYNAESGTTVSVDLAFDNICGFQFNWSDITYSNKGIITSVTGDGSKMNLTGGIYDKGAFYFPVNGSQNAVFTLKFVVSGAVGETCAISVKYKVVDDGSDISREETKEFSITIVPGHTHSYDWKSNDSQHWQECSCGDKINSGSHNWDWVIDTPAGEFTPGKKHEACKTCGLKRNENTPIDPTHQCQFGEWKSDANTHWKECACGEKSEQGDHNWDWVIDAPAGEFTPGKKHEACKVCGLKRNENTPIEPGHQCQYGDWKHDKDTHWKECSCGAKINQGTHTFGNWVTTKHPSATEIGAQERVCSVCGAKQTKQLDPTGESPKPTDPTDPSKPTEPSVPTEPSTPVDPTEPSTPVEPTDPSSPSTTPSEPTTPTEPGEGDPDDHRCCWIWLLIILLIIAALLYFFLVYKKRKERKAK